MCTKLSLLCTYNTPTHTTFSFLVLNIAPYGTNWTAGYPGSFPAGYAYAHQQAGGQQQYGGRMSGTGAGYGGLIRKICVVKEN